MNSIFFIFLTRQKKFFVKKKFWLIAKKRRRQARIKISNKGLLLVRSLTRQQLICTPEFTGGAGVKKSIREKMTFFLPPFFKIIHHFYRQQHYKLRQEHFLPSWSFVSSFPKSLNECYLKARLLKQKTLFQKYLRIVDSRAQRKTVYFQYRQLSRLIPNLYKRRLNKTHRYLSVRTFIGPLNKMQKQQVEWTPFEIKTNYFINKTRTQPLCLFSDPLEKASFYKQIFFLNRQHKKQHNSRYSRFRKFFKQNHNGQFSPQIMRTQSRKAFK